MKRLGAPALPLLTLLLTGWSGATPSEPGAEPMILVDRIVAVVDEDPVFLSDVERIIGLGLVEPAATETAAQLQRRVLDGLVDQRLRFHEVERYEFGPLPLEQIDGRLEEIRSRFPDHQAFEARLTELGLSEAGLRHILTRQLRVLIYVQERLTPRVFVDPEDVRDYYDRVLRPRAALQGIELPPLDDQRQEIRKILREVRLNQQIEIWTEELRLKAEIVDHLDRPPRPLPPVAGHRPETAPPP